MSELIDKVEYFLMNEDYKRIENGLRISKANIPFSIKYLDDIEKYFKSIEEYEKCIIIKKFKEDILNHEKNFILDEYE